MVRHNRIEHTIFDFVIIGSGFGGSVSAYRLAEKGYSVLVLERGKRYESDDFPATNWLVHKYLWAPTVRCFGILGINFFKDIVLLNGSGVGGGSLVYASTHIKPDKAFFEAEEWAELADWEAELEPHYEVAAAMLGTTLNPKMWPADHLLLEMASELGRADTFKPTPVGIFFGEEGETVPDPYFDGEGVERTGCIHCGGCMVGCRYNAKNSLDKNYLYLAQNLGAEVWAESNVVDIRPIVMSDSCGVRYEIIYERSTDWLFKDRQSILARNVVVSAGALGTMQLLMRCRDVTGSLPKLSAQLGDRVRSNSEALVGVTARKGDVDYSQGIAITSHFWFDENSSVEPVRYPRGSSLMRNLAVPIVDGEGGMVKRFGRMFQYALKRPYDFLKVKLLPDWARDSTILLIMQTLDNQFRIKHGRSIWTAFRKGLISEQDSLKPVHGIMELGRKLAFAFAEKSNGIPSSSFNEALLGASLSAHVMGGCSIGKDETDGVIDINHEVFNYPGLYIADGSVIPANLGVNPALTIAAMTERAISRIPARLELPPCSEDDELHLRIVINNQRKNRFRRSAASAAAGAIFRLWRRKTKQSY